MQEPAAIRYNDLVVAYNNMDRVFLHNGDLTISIDVDGCIWLRDQLNFYINEHMEREISNKNG